MTLVVTHECASCGARQRPDARSTAWIRCAHCSAIMAFDYQRWLESPEHAAWLARYAELVPAWTEHARDAADAERAFARGDVDAFDVHMRRACERLFDLTPHAYPPDAHTDPARREAHLVYAVWWRRAEHTDVELASLSSELSSNQARMDYRDPWPTIERSLALVAKQHERIALLDPPPDPDGLALPARVRVAQSFLSSAYLHLLDPDRRLVALRALYGNANVIASRDDTASASERPPSVDELGLYFDFVCTRCGLATLTARGATEVTCVGCWLQRPFRETDLQLADVALACTSCGAALVLDAGEMQTICPFCGVETHRAARTGHVERAFAERVMHSLSPARAGERERYPAHDDRIAHVLAGLARQASWFATLVSPARFAAVMRRSLGARWRDDATVAALLASMEREGCDSLEARTLVANAVRIDDSRS